MVGRLESCRPAASVPSGALPPRPSEPAENRLHEDDATWATGVRGIRRAAGRMRSIHEKYDRALIDQFLRGLPIGRRERTELVFRALRERAGCADVAAEVLQNDLARAFRRGRRGAASAQEDERQESDDELALHGGGYAHGGRNQNDCLHNARSLRDTALLRCAPARGLTFDRNRDVRRGKARIWLSRAAPFRTVIAPLPFACI